MNSKKIKANNKTLIGAAALVAVIGLVGAYTFSNAYQGDYTKKGPNYSTERHELMQKAFDNNDYNAWKNEMNNRGRVTEIINENNFSKFAKAHNLAMEGKYEEANQIREELGLGGRNGNRNGHGYGRMNANHRGQNQNGNFVDKNGDGFCDNLNK